MKNGSRASTANEKRAKETVSFQLEKDALEQVRRECNVRDIPASMWYREAAREKLAAQKRRRARLTKEAVAA